MLTDLEDEGTDFLKGHSQLSVDVTCLGMLESFNFVPVEK